MNKRTFYYSKAIMQISNHYGVSTQTVRNVLGGKTKGKHCDAIFNDYNLLTKKMESQTAIKKPPRHGFINELAKLCGVSRHTVRTAIYDNARGEKADFVRKMYRTKY